MSPQKYSPDMRAVQSNRYKHVGIGYGHKINFSANNKLPGPGAYNLPSIFGGAKWSKAPLN